MLNFKNCLLPFQYFVLLMEILGWAIDQAEETFYSVFIVKGVIKLFDKC